MNEIKLKRIEEAFYIIISNGGECNTDLRPKSCKNKKPLKCFFTKGRDCADISNAEMHHICTQYLNNLPKEEIFEYKLLKQIKWLRLR